MGQLVRNVLNQFYERGRACPASPDDPPLNNSNFMKITGFSLSSLGTFVSLNQLRVKNNGVPSINLPTDLERHKKFKVL